MFADRDLIILEQIEQYPNTSQAALASKLEVAVGTVNWHLKRLIEKGYIKVSRLERKKLKYLITSEGIALRARLTVDYVQNSFDVYRSVRQQMMRSLEEVKASGRQQVRIDGNGDVAEICRLTCMEQEIQVVEEGNAPVIRLNGLKVILLMEDKV